MYEEYILVLLLSGCTLLSTTSTLSPISEYSLPKLGWLGLKGRLRRYSQLMQFADHQASKMVFLYSTRLQGLVKRSTPAPSRVYWHLFWMFSDHCLVIFCATVDIVGIETRDEYGTCYKQLTSADDSGDKKSDSLLTEKFTLFIPLRVVEVIRWMEVSGPRRRGTWQISILPSLSRTLISFGQQCGRINIANLSLPNLLLGLESSLISA